MTSADKVLCPWCGAEMSACYSRGKVLGEWKDYYDAHLRCTGCGAQGPFARWNTPEGAKEAARAATLQRYTPPIRQMTLEEVIEESLKVNDCYSADLFQKIIDKRKMSKIECFKHIHPEIMPMFKELKYKEKVFAIVSVVLIGIIWLINTVSQFIAP